MCTIKGFFHDKLDNVTFDSLKEGQHFCVYFGEGIYHLYQKLSKTNVARFSNNKLDKVIEPAILLLSNTDLLMVYTSENIVELFIDNANTTD